MASKYFLNNIVVFMFFFFFVPNFSIAVAPNINSTEKSNNTDNETTFQLNASSLTTSLIESFTSNM